MIRPEIQMEIDVTPEPRDGGGIAGPVPSSPPARGWRRVVALLRWLDDSLVGAALGVVALFGSLAAALFIAWGFQP